MRHDIPPLLLDRSVGGERARVALEELGFRAILKHELTGGDRHSDRTPDEVWLRRAGQKQLVIVTADRRIMRNRLEREALLASGTWAFVLTNRDQTHDSLVRIFERHGPRIAQAIQFEPPPAVWRLNLAGLARILL